MSKWKNECESILTALGILYNWRRFTTSPEQPQLPDTYIVYFLVDDPAKTHADGKETAHEPRIQVSLYFRNKSEYLTIPDQIEAAFIAANFMRVGVGDLPFDKETGHHGWRCDFRKYERR